MVQDVFEWLVSAFHRQRLDVLYGDARFFSENPSILLTFVEKAGPWLFKYLNRGERPVST